MTIPHYDEVREARATLRDNEGAEQLLLDLERAQTLLGLQRKAPSDELPGEAEIARLVQWPGLEAIRSADAPEDAPWTARVRARELALQGAAQLLSSAFPISMQIDSYIISQTQSTPHLSVLMADPSLVSELKSMHESDIQRV